MGLIIEPSVLLIAPVERLKKVTRDDRQQQKKSNPEKNDDNNERPSEVSTHHVDELV
jgi:hypothetical protein